MGRRIENFLSPFSANTGYVFAHTSINMLLMLCVRRLYSYQQIDFCY